MAKLYFRYGAMNCGKSLMLLTVSYNYDKYQKKIIVIKPACDTKGEDNIDSRVGEKRKVDIMIGSDESFVPYYKEWTTNNINCILVDEAQFLTSNQVDELFYVSKILDIPVICYGIRTDFQTKLFEGSKRLMELADQFEEIPNICSCGKKSKFNARYVNGVFSNSGNQIIIDGSSNSVEYKPLCGKCYIKEMLTKKG